MEQQEFHKNIASEGFNKCWHYIDMATRTVAEDEEMRRMAEVSFWHWMQVDGHTKENESVGYWQLARVYAISSRYHMASYYADKCIEVSEGNELAPFYIGYGYEAKARAFALSGRLEEAREALDEAYEFTDIITDPESKELIIADLDQIRGLFPY